MAARELSPLSQVEDVSAGSYVKKVKSLQDKKVKKAENPLAMFQPSGWFRDEFAAELSKRSDKTIPDRPHPLSFVELRKYGFENLSDAIIALGGPHEVGKLVGIEWTVPEMDKEEWDESLRPVREELFTLDMRGSLFLGSALEDKLSSAAEIDLEAVKESLKKNDEDNATLTQAYGRGSSGMFVDEDGEIDYKKAKPFIKKKKIFKDEPEVPRSERFSLTQLQRLYFVSLCVSSALAYGRASGDLASTKYLGETGEAIVSAASAGSVFLISAALLSVGLSVVSAKEKNRNPLVWGAKGLFGGPLTVLQLKGLENL
jgi:hypothetical protein